MKEVVIYGAGKNGKIAYLSLHHRDDISVVCFVDSNKQKIGSTYLGLDVNSINDIKRDGNTQIIVTPDEGCFDIIQNLKEAGFKDVIPFNRRKHNIRGLALSLYEELNQNRCIDLGKLLLDVFGDGDIVLKELPYIYGGSGVLDYAFLYALAIKFNISGYAEIGSYIGTSLNVLSGVCSKLFSITAPVDSKYSMRSFCEENNIPDYSERLSESKSIEHIYCNSQEHTYSDISPYVDMYFIDADHSYEGVYNDTLCVFRDRKPDSIVVWHDFQQNGLFDEVIIAVKDALKEDFNKVFITDNNICAVYLPKGNKEIFPLTHRKYVSQEDRRLLYVYDTTLHIGERN